MFVATKYLSFLTKIVVVCFQISSNACGWWDFVEWHTQTKIPKLT